MPSTSAATSESTPLLRNKSQLNPLATTFSFAPSPSSFNPPASPTPIPLAPRYDLPPVPSATDEDWMARRAHTLSPHTRTHSSNSSEFSFASITPTRRAFRRVHLWVQFPISFIVSAGLVGGLYAWKMEVRWAELGLGVTAWLAGESVKEFVHECFDWDTSGEGVGRGGGTGWGVKMATVFHAILQELLRLGAISLAVALLPESVMVPVGKTTTMPQPGLPGRSPHRPLPPLDTLFFSALWLGLGWALIEIFWGSRDFWRRMKLYDDVLEESEEDDEEEDLGDEVENEIVVEGAGEYGSTLLTQRGIVEDSRPVNFAQNGDKHLQFLTNSAFDRVIGDPAAREQDELEMDARIRGIERDEVEAQMGVPLWEIPVIVVIVWRIDSILLSLVLTLLLSLPFRTTHPSLVPFPLWPTFIAAATIHVLISLCWILRVRFVGIPSISYGTLVLLVGALFGVLAAWGALE